MPKRIAGVKLPKPWRRAVEAMLAEAASPAGRAVAAAALMAGAAALTRVGGEDAAERPGAPEGLPPARPPVDVGALIGMANGFLGSLRAAGERGTGREQGPA